ncbi:TPA: superoxide dismutase, partial [Acinetobacter baumannii]|nr:superoxide dismutase [Acinetobacter baumannii]
MNKKIRFIVIRISIMPVFNKIGAVCALTAL